MEWLANSMENLWGGLCPTVHADGKEYTNVSEETYLYSYESNTTKRCPGTTVAYIFKHLSKKKLRKWPQPRN